MKMTSLFHRMALWPAAFSIAAAVFLVGLSGCGTTSPTKPANYSANDVALPQSTNDIVLKEGDVVKVVFPNGQPDSVQTIRPDGKITLPDLGDVAASGKTPPQFQKELIDKYSKDLRSSELISVVVVSSSFQVYVMGAVLHPGKVAANHPLTALEAIMEAGGYDPDRAQLKSVKVVRTKAGRTQTFFVDLKGVQVPGNPVQVFDLKPNDIVMVPTKVVWF